MSDLSDKELLESLSKHFKHSKFKSDVQKNAIKRILQSESIKFEKMHSKTKLFSRKIGCLCLYADGQWKKLVLSFAWRDTGQQNHNCIRATSCVDEKSA